MAAFSLHSFVSHPSRRSFTRATAFPMICDGLTSHLEDALSHHKMAMVNNKRYVWVARGKHLHTFGDGCTKSGRTSSRMSEVIEVSTQI